MATGRLGTGLRLRIAGIEIRGHPGFGDLDVDFRAADGRAARLVVLAGENGCGKTALLEAIFTALTSTRYLSTIVRRLAPGRYRVLVDLDGPNYSQVFTSPISPETFHEIRGRWPGFDGIAIDLDGDAVRRGQLLHSFTRIADNLTCTGQETDAVFGIASRCFYSEASVSFDVPRVEVIRASGDDAQAVAGAPPTMFPLRSGGGLAAEVAQLLVDLRAADAAEVARWLDRNEGRPPEEVRNRRVRRFSEAFARVMPNKRFTDVLTEGGEHRAMFEDGAFRTALADLSTGEKQVLFRGAFLLRQSEGLPGSVVLVDEPELSLHPGWQSNILGYYDGIVAETADRSSQVIVATHSPFVVHGSPTARHVVLRRDREAGAVRVDPEPAYPGATTADVAVAAFDVGSFVRGASGHGLALIVEGPTDAAILAAAWDRLRPGRPRPFAAIPAGGARGVQNLLGPSEPGRAGPLLAALAGAGPARVLGLFDFDGEGFGQWNGAVKRAHCDGSSDDVGRCAFRKRRGAAVWAALLPVPPHRAAYAGLDPAIAPRSILTIELLFPDEHVAGLLSWHPVVGAPDARILQAASEAQKQAVADAAKDFPHDAFGAFEPICALLELVSTYPDL